MWRAHHYVWHAVSGRLLCLPHTMSNVRRATCVSLSGGFPTSQTRRTTHRTPCAAHQDTAHRARARPPNKAGAKLIRARANAHSTNASEHTHTPTQVAHITTPCAPQHTRHTAHLTPHAAQRAQRTHTPRARVCTHAHAHAHQRKSLSPCTPREPPNIKRARKTHHRNN